MVISFWGGSAKTGLAESMIYFSFTLKTTGIAILLMFRRNVLTTEISNRIDFKALLNSKMLRDVGIQWHRCVMFGK